MRYLVRISFLGFACASFCVPADTPRESVEVERILDLSQAAPPELAADLRLQLAERALLRTKRVQFQAIQDAFDLANSATWKLPLASTNMGAAMSTDSDAGTLNSASALHTDTFSLKLRAVHAFLRSDAKRALDSFGSIPEPQITRLACRNAMRYSPDIYYKTLESLYKVAFSVEDRKKGRDQEFLIAHLARHSTAFELEPAARLLNTLKLNKEQFAEAATHFTQALTEIPDDDRSFTATTTYSLMNEIYSLAQATQKNGLPVYQLVFSLGNYLRDHLHTVRCADSAASGFHITMEKAIANDFNTRFHNLGPDTKNIPLLTPEDLQPTSLGGKVEVYSYWDKPEAREMMARYKRLRFGSPEEQSADPQSTARNHMAPYLGRAQRNQDEWLARATDYLHSLDEWDLSGEPGTAAFHQKCLGYHALLDIIPQGNLRRTVFTEYLEFLRDSPVQRESPPEWALRLERLLKEQFEEKDEPEFRRAITESGNTAMQAYADLITLNSASR